MVLHLVLVPADSDAEEEPTARDEVEGRNRLREHDRVVLCDEADAGAELEPLGDGRGGAEGDERIQRVAVLLRQVAPAWPRGATANRDVGVLGEPE